MGAPKVSLARSVLRRVAVQAAGHTREGGGLLVGRWTAQNTIHVYHEFALPYIDANRWHIHYDGEEVAHVREVAFNEYGPRLSPIGGWHSHLFSKCVDRALEHQLSGEDIEDMQTSEIELVVSTFPRPPRRVLVNDDTHIHRFVGATCCRFEVWFKESGTTLCPIRAR